MNAGAIDVKRAGFGSILERRERQCIKVVGTLLRPNVATLSQLYIEVNMQQRRDVSASFVLSSLKAKRGCRIRGIEDRTS